MCAGVLKDGFCDYNHTSSKSSTCLESRTFADPLSRLLHANKQAEPSARKVSDEFVRFVKVTATPQAITAREIEEASSEDRELIELSHDQCIKNGTCKGDQHKQYILVCS